MVLESLESTLFLAVAILAALAAVMGIVVLEGFFRNKLKDLFNDVNYFIFFFIVAGYFLYALGEVSFFLTRKVFKNAGQIGIQDVYWTGGAFLIFVSFIALSLLLHREKGRAGKFFLQALVGTAIVILVSSLILGFSQKSQDYSFVTFYPIISALIVAASFSIILYFKELGPMAQPLAIFWMASCLILIGDILFSFGTAKSILTITDLLSDAFYLLGYGVSGIGFLALRVKMNRLAFENSNSKRTPRKV
ncbi:MAG TPA: hypothetical protein VJI98_03505 [Candidatus Nanoarchaeia archaeon]|nr:hypothetical protein [Candidatus Nanoarchaeia archaeon]